MFEDHGHGASNHPLGLVGGAFHGERLNGRELLALPWAHRCRQRYMAPLAKYVHFSDCKCKLIAFLCSSDRLHTRPSPTLLHRPRWYRESGDSNTTYKPQDIGIPNHSSSNFKYPCRTAQREFPSRMRFKNCELPQTYDMLKCVYWPRKV